MSNPCPACNGDGNVPHRLCPECSGRGKIRGIVCESCNGRGKEYRNCRTCGGTGMAYVRRESEKDYGATHHWHK